MDAIEEQYNRIRLYDEEEGGFTIPQMETVVEANDFRWSLIGQFLTDISINVSVMQNTLAFLWRPVKGVTIKEIQPALFLFQFYHELDTLKVINKGP